MSGPSHLAQSSTVMLTKFDGPLEDESKRSTSSDQLGSEACQLKQLSHEETAKLQLQQDTTCDSPVKIPLTQLEEFFLDSELSADDNIAPIIKETARGLPDGDVHHTTQDNKLPGVQAQESHQEDANGFKDNISESENINENSEATLQIKMAFIQEASDNNNSSNRDIDLKGSNGYPPSDNFHEGQQKNHLSGEQQTTQDSDLSPSHSSISAKTNNDNDDINKEQEQMNSSTLGRNRRVRQKNRYFNDFHCMQLVKGCRSRDDYDASSPSTSVTRSSNRKSTTDSSRNSSSLNNANTGKTEQTREYITLDDLFTKKYCRKCCMIRYHDEKNQCQICLYDQIIEAERRRKASLRSHSKKLKGKSPESKTPPKGQQPNQLHPQDEASQMPQDPTQNQDKPLDEHKQIVNSITIKQEQGHQQAKKKQKSDSRKRKWVVKPGKSPNDDNVISICREVDPCSQDGSGRRETNDEPKRKVIIKTTDDQLMEDKMMDDGCTRSSSSSDSTSTPSSKSIDSNAINIAGDNDIDNQTIQLANSKPDTWTPEQVAQYVSSRGFVSESDLFREQDVDGISLLMMKKQDFTYGLKMKLGPALKLYEQVCRLRRDYDRDAAMIS